MIIDRYIARSFVVALLWSLATLVCIYIITDIFNMLPTFVDRKVPFFRIIEFYLYEIPSIITTVVMPIACLLACFLSIGSLSRNFEICAMRAAGISLYKIHRPLFMLGVIITLGILFMDETLTPWANRRERNFRREKIAGLPPRSVRRRNVYYMGRGQKFYHIDRVDGKKNLLEGVTIFEFTPDYKVKRRINANKAIYSDSWTLIDGIIVEFKEDGEKVSQFKELKAYDIEEKLEDFIKEARESEEMNFFELRNYISWLRHAGKDATKEYVDLHTKISFPFMNLIIIFLGAPLAVRVRRSGFVLGFGISLLMAFVYWSLSQTTRAFGQAGDIPAWLAAWLPNIIFGVLGGLLLWDISR